MAHDVPQMKIAIAGFTLLLATVAELVRAKASKQALLDAYDDACDQIIDGLRDGSMTDAELQTVHKALARLRLAFEVARP